MGGAVRLRQDFRADELRRLAAKAKDGAQARRLLALAAVHDGMNRSEAARIGGMDRQTLRDWVHRFNQCGPEGLIDIKPPGRPSTREPIHELRPRRPVCDGSMNCLTHCTKKLHAKNFARHLRSDRVAACKKFSA